MIFPAIDVQKSANPTIVRSGSDVTYTYVVTNTGDTPLGLTLDDDKLDALDCLVTPTTKGGPGGDQDDSFEPGEIWTFQCVAPIVSDTTNTVTATGTTPVGPNVTDTDSATVDVIAPAVNVVKTASANTIHAGDPVTYTYVVTLGGDGTPLTSITMVDDKLPPGVTCLANPVKTGGDLDAVLEALETWTFQCTATLQADTTNLGTATGTAPDGGAVTDNDTQTVDVLAPGIIVVKKVDGQDSVTVSSGTAVTYTYTVTNPGDTPLTVSLDDDKLPALQCLVDHSGDSNANALLDPGETWLYTCAGQILPDDTLNTVTATGVDPLGGETGTVTATDTANVDVIDPGIVVDKTTSTPTIGVGGLASYAYAVTNGGDVPLANVTVTDDKCSPVVFGSGDTNGNSLLDVGETWTYSCSTNLAADTTNTATATGFDVNGDPVTATDTATVDVIHPGIVVDKTTSTPSIGVGGIATYSYAVTNGGDTPLRNVTVTDDKCSPVVFGSGDTNGDSLLDVAETWTYSCSIVLTVDTTNTATATGFDVNGVPVTDTDTADVDVVPPAEQVDLAIQKLVDKSAVVVGDTVTYTLRVTNVGNGPAADATVTDNVPSGLAVVSVVSSDFTCNTGQAITCTRTAPVVVGAVYTITVVTTVLASAPSGATINVARVTGTQVDSNPNNNTNNVEITVNAIGGPANVRAAADHRGECSAWRAGGFSDDRARRPRAPVHSTPPKQARLSPAQARAASIASKPASWAATASGVASVPSISTRSVGTPATRADQLSPPPCWVTSGRTGIAAAARPRLLECISGGTDRADIAERLMDPDDDVGMQPLDEHRQRLRLGLARCGGSPVVRAPLPREVPVQIDAVGVAPQPRGGPVRVGDGDQPHLDVVVDVGLQEAAHGRWRDRLVAVQPTDHDHTAPRRRGGPHERLDGTPLHRSAEHGSPPAFGQRRRRDVRGRSNLPRRRLFGPRVARELADHRRHAGWGWGRGRGRRGRGLRGDRGLRGGRGLRGDRGGRRGGRSRRGLGRRRNGRRRHRRRGLDGRGGPGGLDLRRAPSGAEAHRESSQGHDRGSADPRRTATMSPGQSARGRYERSVTRNQGTSRGE